VDEDPDCPLGTIEDAGDLGRGHLVDEAQDDRPATIAVEAADGPPGCGRVVAQYGVGLEVDRRAIRSNQTRKVEAPSPSAGRARSSKRWRLVSAARNVRSVTSSAS